MSDIHPDPSPKSFEYVLSNRDAFILKRYEDISNEARHNSRTKWHVNSLFITALFLLTGYFFIAPPENNQFYFILMILSVLWFMMFYNVAWDIRNRILMKLRDDIAKGNKCETFNERDSKKGDNTKLKVRIRPSYILIIFAFAYHSIFIFYSYNELSKFEGILIAVILFILEIPFLSLKLQDILHYAN